MTPQVSSGSGLPNPSKTIATAPPSWSGLIGAGLLCWIATGLGFFGLHVLMQERPEFVGQPMRSSKTELVQESPRVVIRKLSDDVAVIKSAQPASSGRRIPRGGCWRPS